MEERIRQLRKNLGLTQANLAERSGISVNTIARYERGEMTPSIPNLKQLAQALNVSEAELLNGPADTKARFEIIFNKELWEGEDIDMTGNLFSLLLSSDGHIGI